MDLQYQHKNLTFSPGNQAMTMKKQKNFPEKKEKTKGEQWFSL